MYIYRNLLVRALLLFILIGYGCTPHESGSNLDAVISPYRLFFGTENGEVINTNNGSDFRIYRVGAGVSINNILTINDYLFFNTGLISRQMEGENTANVVYNNLGDPVYYPFAGGNMIYAEDEGVLYAASDGNSPLIYSNDMGDTWMKYDDASFVSGNIDPDNAASVLHVEGGGTFFSDGEVSPNRKQKVYAKNNGTQVGWDEVNPPDFEDGVIYRFALSTNNKILAYDVMGVEDLIFYSIGNNNKLTNIRTKEIPADAGKILRAKFYYIDYVFLCAENGLYKLDLRSNLFTKLKFPEVGQLTAVDITFKKTIYRSGNEKESMFVATDKGLFESIDMGESFTKIYDGVITQLN